MNLRTKLKKNYDTKTIQKSQLSRHDVHRTVNLHPGVSQDPDGNLVFADHHVELFEVAGVLPLEDVPGLAGDSVEVGKRGKSSFSCQLVAVAPLIGDLVSVPFLRGLEFSVLQHDLFWRQLGITPQNRHYVLGLQSIIDKN